MLAPATLGCSKCRYTPQGCAKCRAAPGAPPAASEDLPVTRQAGGVADGPPPAGDVDGQGAVGRLIRPHHPPAYLAGYSTTTEGKRGRGGREGGGDASDPPDDDEGGDRIFAVDDTVAVVGELEGDRRYVFVGSIIEKGRGPRGDMCLLIHYEEENHGRLGHLLVPPGEESDRWLEEEASLIHVQLKLAEGLCPY